MIMELIDNKTFLSLAEARKSRNLSQIELSEKTGITQSLISRYERGMGNPTMKILRRLAEVLDMNLHIAFIEKSNN